MVLDVKEINTTAEWSIILSEWLRRINVFFYGIEPEGCNLME